MSIKKHWETIYNTKSSDEMSWTQDVPKTSLDFIHHLGISKSANIIDIGGGESKLVDFLIDEGFKNITVLDISEKALERAKKRLGYKSKKVKWIVSDITNFEPDIAYDLWHDRATFHFLTTTGQIDKYLGTARKFSTGYMVIGTFSDNGPKKCSGLEITQYSEEKLQNRLADDFEKIRCITENHTTPFNTVQNFLFCSFKRKLSE